MNVYKASLLWYGLSGIRGWNLDMTTLIFLEKEMGKRSVAGKYENLTVEQRDGREKV